MKQLNPNLKNKQKNLKRLPLENDDPLTFLWEEGSSFSMSWLKGRTAGDEKGKVHWTIL